MKKIKLRNKLLILLNKNREDDMFKKIKQVASGLYFQIKSH